MNPSTKRPAPHREERAPENTKEEQIYRLIDTGLSISEMKLRPERQDAGLQRLRRLAERRAVIGRNREDRVRVQHVEYVPLNLPCSPSARQLELAREAHVQLVQPRQIEASGKIEVDGLGRLARRQ